MIELMERNMKLQQNQANLFKEKMKNDYQYWQKESPKGTEKTQDKRISNTSTPMSMFQLSEQRSRISKTSKQNVQSINDIYSNMTNKLLQMQNALKESKDIKQRQMLATYIKVLQKIGDEVVTAKHKYTNLDKETLKNDKRMEIVTQLNEYRTKCHDNRVSLRQSQRNIKALEQQNQFIENQIKALEQLEIKKQLSQKKEKTTYRESKKKILSFLKESGLNDVRFYSSKKNRLKINNMNRTLDLDKNKIDENYSALTKLQNPQFIKEFQTNFVVGGQYNKKQIGQKHHLGVNRRKNKFFDFQFQNNGSQMNNIFDQQNCNNSKIDFVEFGQTQQKMKFKVNGTKTYLKSKCF